MEGRLLMSQNERNRKSVFDRVKDGQLKLINASRILGISYRQCRRSYSRYAKEGDSGLVHHSRGKTSNRAKTAQFREEVLMQYEMKYKKFGPTLASEKLAADGYEVDHETLRRWLLKAGFWEKTRRSRAHRNRRTPRENFGDLVQIDGSHHRWFGEDEPEACLMSMVDDARGETLVLMAHEETTEAAMLLLWKWIELYGVPVALYSDRKNVFVTERKATIEEQLAGVEPATAFGKACAKMNIKIIKAHSPQAKGRVERKHGVFQDRLVKELHLRGIKTIEGANELLSSWFCAHINEKFSKAPASPEDFHRAVDPSADLAGVFSFEDMRKLQNDWVVSHKNNLYQILKENSPMPRPKDTITVQTRLDGSVWLKFKDQFLKYKKIKQRPQTDPELKAAASRKPWRPGPGHPWKKGYQKAMERAAQSMVKRKPAQSIPIQSD